MSKVIIFCRVSTDSQEVESQLKETKEYAISLGYNEKDFIYISSIGASAVKLNTLYQQTIQQLKDYILSGEISAVVVYHLNRLCRNDVIAMELKQLLIENNVQLHVKEPTISLLNVDGSVNSGAELCFSLFATLNKQNAIELKTKTLRGKRAKAEKGLYGGGGIPFGYLVENDVFIINPDEKYIVETIFDLYNNGLSESKIVKELIETKVVESITKTRVNTILHNSNYCGNNAFPQLIDSELFNQVQEKIKSNTIVRSSKHYYFGARIFKCQCGLAYNVWHNELYNCISENKSVPHSKGLSVAFLDGLLYKVVYDRINTQLKKTSENNRNNLIKKINALSMKSIKLATDLDKFKEKYSRLQDLYIDGLYSKSEYNIKKTQLQIKENTIKEQLKSIELDLNYLTNVYVDKSIYNPMDNNYSSQDIQRLINQHIKLISYIDNTITVTFVDNTTFICYYKRNRKDIKFWLDKDFSSPLETPFITHKGETFEIETKTKNPQS